MDADYDAFLKDINQATSKFIHDQQVELGEHLNMAPIPTNLSLTNHANVLEPSALIATSLVETNPSFLQFEGQEDSENARNKISHTEEDLMDGEEDLEAAIRDNQTLFAQWQDRLTALKRHAETVKAGRSNVESMNETFSSDDDI
jgi:FtsZ-binding cell division protein ZapB